MPVSQCRKVEVYTWQKNKTLYTYLDIDEVKENKQQNINDVEEKDLPEK